MNIEGGDSMNFNEEMMQEMKEAGLDGAKLIEIPLEERATFEDYAKLQRKIELRTRENEIMLILSMQYAENSRPCF